MWTLLIISLTADLEYRSTMYNTYETEMACQIERYLVSVEYEYDSDLLICVEDNKPSV